MKLAEWYEEEVKRLTPIEVRLLSEWKRADDKRVVTGAQVKSPYQQKLEWLLGYVPGAEDGK